MLGNTEFVNRMSKFEKDLLTGMGRLLILLARMGGEAEQSRLTKEMGGTYYTAIMKAIDHDLVSKEGYRVSLTEKGKKLAECLLNCLSSI